jgi:hypothetical protein
VKSIRSKTDSLCHSDYGYGTLNIVLLIPSYVILVAMEPKAARARAPGPDRDEHRDGAKERARDDERPPPPHVLGVALRQLVKGAGLQQDRPDRTGRQRVISCCNESCTGLAQSARLGPTL